LYTVVVAYIFDNVGVQRMISNGQTYTTDYKTTNGYKCITWYSDKDIPKNPLLAVKPTILVVFEKNETPNCPNSPKYLDISKQEALQILQNRLNQSEVPPIIIAPE
jgi:hypothetical protein